MSLQDVLVKRQRVKVEKEVVVVPTPTLPVVDRAYFVPAKDKIFAIDKSRDCSVERDSSIHKGIALHISVAMLFRRLRKVRPELQYVCKHTANVFGKKTCYIFLDTKRQTKIALTRQEVKEQITKG
jgi:hypothetical protein